MFYIIKTVQGYRYWWNENGCKWEGLIDNAEQFSFTQCETIYSRINTNKEKQITIKKINYD